MTSMLLSVNPKADLSLFYRNISSAYRSLYASAFTENSSPVNERGLYAGINVNPGGTMGLSAYADIFNFPWLKYGVDAHSLQVTYAPAKNVHLYSRFISNKKGGNYNPDNLPSNPVVMIPRQNWRTNLTYIINNTITFRCRAEASWYNNNTPAAERGFLTYADISWKRSKRFSAAIRLQYFETDGYNSRIYAYEEDILYSFSIPVFYDKGYRYYVNLNYNFSRKLSGWFRIAQSIYPDKSTISSGLDQISGNKKTEMKIQALYKF